MIRVCIGFDRVETIAWYVFAHSILSRSSQPVALIPVNRRNIQGLYNRPRGEKDSTDFSNSRWIVPSLMDYEGWAIFADSDMLMRGDIAQLWAMRDDRYSIICRKHVHVPQETTKFLGQEQTKYHRKNWSSLMLMNCSRLKMLSRHLVNTAPGLWMHRMEFLPDDEIGDLPVGWNHLVGYDEYNEEADLVHYTSLGPWHDPSGEQHIEYSTEWKSVLRDMVIGDNPHLRRYQDVEKLMR